jgi:hypothetical protein
MRDTFLKLVDQLNAADREEKVWNTKIFMGHLLSRLRNSEEQVDTVCWLLEMHRRGLS